jgi:hypothetical protein
MRYNNRFSLPYGSCHALHSVSNLANAPKFARAPPRLLPVEALARSQLSPDHRLLTHGKLPALKVLGEHVVDRASCGFFPPG